MTNNIQALIRKYEAELLRCEGVLKISDDAEVKAVYKTRMRDLEGFICELRGLI